MSFRRWKTSPDSPGSFRFPEIEKNDFNLNLPRYIDNREAEDIQDIDAHLNGGIPARDLDDLTEYWTLCPSLRDALFTESRPGYFALQDTKADLKSAIHQHTEFAAFLEGMTDSLHRVARPDC